MAQADLVLTATGASQTNPGGLATVQYTLKDLGPSDTTGYRITFTMPDGMTLASAGPDPWKCTQTGQKGECVWSPPQTIAATARSAPIFSPLVVQVKTPNPATSSSYGITATATSAVPDPTPETATSIGDIPMTPVDLAVAKSAGSPVLVKREAQTAPALPPSPRRILSGKTDQGRNLTTRVRCRPVASASAGEVSYCKVRRANGVVHVKVVGSKKMKVIVLQTAKGTKALRPFAQRRAYIVTP